jgi:hypothetical protein
MKIQEKATVVNLKEFPAELHRRAKAQAALTGISLKELFIRAVTEYLKKTDGGWKKGGV